MEQRLTPPGAQVNTATLTAATTGVVVMMVEQWLFHGALPKEVYFLLQLGFPALCGRVGAELTYRRAKSHRDFP